MNQQNFKNGNAMFPISTDALEFMQQQTFLVARLTELAGSRVIITQPANNKAGLCVFDGELLPLTGNPSDTHIAISEVPMSIIAHGTSYENVRVTREAVYGTNGESVNTFVVLNNMVTLKSAIATLTTALETEATTRARHDLPKGAIIDWYGTIAVSSMPYGFLPCGKIVVGSIEQVHTEQSLWSNKYHGGFEWDEGYNGNGYYYRIKKWNDYTIPDLTDRFIVQAGGEYSLGKTDGKKSITLEPKNLPPHKHSIGIGETNQIHDHSTKGVKRVEIGVSTLTDATVYDVNGDIVTKENVSAISFDNRPPFFALYKLIKVI